MLRIKNVYKSYKDKNVLKGVSFYVQKGEIKGLVGVNGAGKSTLIEIICGVKSYDCGEIFINGFDTSDKKSKKKIKEVIGYMPQSFSLFNDLTVEENLGYLCAIYNLDIFRADEIIDLCGLKEHRKVLARNLSGGYRQLLSMAGAIIHSPKLLILDEPTSAMDPVFRRKFWEIVKQCHKNGELTVLVITHYMEELVECDNFVCLANGKVSFDGSLSEYKKDGMLNIEQILNKYTMKE
jgi:ABC-2 type transport system ATP-binding protein